MAERDDLARFIVDNLDNEASDAQGGYIRDTWGPDRDEVRLDMVVIDGEWDVLALAHKLIAAGWTRGDPA
jgi:hypothetical protein